MLYKREEFPVEASGFAETTHFDIPPSGKAFKSLIDNIYSRKKEAPIRELSTNAWDAHREAGIDEPFRMKLPTKFDPLFMVRDYGLGMTHDFIMGTGEFKGGGFKSLFASTKDHENVSVGMKGLGSKSPFAYTDSFILRIFTGQTVRTYSTYIGVNGIPQLAYQGESPSDERRGTAVQFPVEMKDIDEFYSSAIRVLKGFDVLPEGLPQTVIDGLTGYTSEPLEKGSFWATYRKEWLGEGAWAKQGCVIYPIDVDKIGAKWIGTLGQCLVIDFPIGSVQMVDSREFLAYDEETIANIAEAVAKIKGEIDAKIDAMLSRASTNWELRALFRNDMFASLGPLARSSGKYSRITAINNYMKECLVRSKKYRNTSHQVFYSIVSPKGGSSDTYVAYTRNDEAYNENLLDNPAFVYVGFDTKVRRAMNARAKLLMGQDPSLTGVVILEKLPLRLHRKLGKPKIYRVKDLPEMPVKPKADRAPVVWDRFKHTDNRIISEEEIETLQDEGTKLVYLFQNKGSNYLEPKKDEEVQYLSRGDLHLANELLTRFRNTKIILINVRANEKLSRWPEKDFPRYDPDSTKDILRTLGKDDIVPMINVINQERFSGSIYYEALDNIGEERIKRLRQLGKNNPLFDLDRFDRRGKRVQKHVRSLVDQVGDHGAADIVDRALELGLEVLPEQIPVDRWWEANSVFPYPLLRGKWERMAKLFGEKSDAKREAAIFDLAMGGML